MLFLVQKINGRIIHDFSFELINSIDYLKWKGIEASFVDIDISDTKDVYNLNKYTPVGSLEFVFNVIDNTILKGSKISSKTLIKPINIPVQLKEYSYDHNVENIYLNKGKNIISNHLNKVFIKSNDIIKHDINGVYKINNNVIELPESGNYQITDYIYDIISEYRCFIYNDELKGIQNYSGDFEVFPDITTIHNMIKKYNYDYGHGNAPQAYTLDVYVDSSGRTGIIECHEFFSCGLYGFNDYTCLPYMFKRTYDNIIKRIIMMKQYL